MQAGDISVQDKTLSSLLYELVVFSFGLLRGAGDDRYCLRHHGGHGARLDLFKCELGW